MASELQVASQFIVENQQNIWNILSALGTWAGAVFAAIAASYLYKLQKKVFDDEIQYKELEFKISLYEKRYNLYLILNRYIETFNAIKKLNITINVPENEKMPRHIFSSMLLFSTTLQGVPSEGNILYLNYIISKNYQSSIDQIKFYFEDTKLHELCTNLISAINAYALDGETKYADAVSAIDQFEMYGAMGKIEQKMYTYKNLS